VSKPPATIRTHTTFRTDRFNRTEVRPHFINPNCFGDDCAAWLVAGLRQRGWTEVSEPWQEDWGWQTSTARNGHRYLISIGLMEEDDPEWLVHVQEHTGWLTKLRGQAGPSALRDLVGAIHEVLSAGPDIRQVRWQFEDLFIRGTVAGESDPLAPRTAAESAGS
jgi:hypothetical protein